MDKRWIVWSNEHGAWWRPNWNGYTQDVHQAGRYDDAELDSILKTANSYIKDGDPPNEVACLAPRWRP